MKEKRANLCENEGVKCLNYIKNESIIIHYEVDVRRRLGQKIRNSYANEKL